MKCSPRPELLKRSCGFTLIELLVTVALIAILLGGVGLALVGSGRGDVGAGERVLQGFLISARTQAIIQQGDATFPAAPAPAEGASALLLINGDTTDLENYLREVTVVYWGTDVDGAEGWISASGFDSLPNGVYFDVDESRDSAATTTLTAMTINLDRPSAIAQSTAGATTWHYVPFDAQGRLPTSLGEFRVVIGAGTQIPSGGAASIEWDDERAKGGYIVLGMGSMYRFPNEAAISAP